MGLVGKRATISPDSKQSVPYMPGFFVDSENKEIEVRSKMGLR